LNILPSDFEGRWQREALTEGFFGVTENPSTAFGGPPPLQMQGRIIYAFALMKSSTTGAIFSRHLRPLKMP
jgi:hypothetical protein